MAEAGAAKKRSTIKEVAARAGVTIGTVSHVINGTAPISEPTAKRVKNAIKELDYVPNLAARSMRGKSNRQIGLIFPKLTNGFYAEIASALIDEANREDYAVLILSYEYSLEHERRGLYSMVENNVETIVLANGSGDEQYIKEARDKGIHVIAADRKLDMNGVSWVAYDNIGGMADVIELLKSKGYKSIGYISEPLLLQNLSDRFEGYRQGIKKAGYKFERKNVFISETFREGHTKNGYAYMKALLEKRRKEYLPDAFIASSDALAIGVMKAIADSGYSVPGDFGVVGFDNLELSEYVRPALTTVHQDRGRLGEEIWKMIIGYRNGEKDRHVVLDQKIILRDSC